MLFAVALAGADGEFTADDGAGNLIGGGEEFETSSDAPAEEVRARKMHNTKTSLLCQSPFPTVRTS